MGRRRRSIFRVPSIRKRVAARASVKRAIRHRLGLKAPRGWGWVTNPRRAAYNRVYNRSSIGCASALIAAVALGAATVLVMAR